MLLLLHSITAWHGSCPPWVEALRARTEILGALCEEKSVKWVHALKFIIECVKRRRAKGGIRGDGQRFLFRRHWYCSEVTRRGGGAALPAAAALAPVCGIARHAAGA